MKLVRASIHVGNLCTPTVCLPTDHDDVEAVFVKKAEFIDQLPHFFEFARQGIKSMAL